ncbi:uncharacterized protein isoform X2 [Rhodnius prolixus]|uniref:uncharacterized protein isoform X2 n=1 Tax=Rhodnius prolixus TaxID=13249 RepID=UPI003D18D984
MRYLILILYLASFARTMEHCHQVCSCLDSYVDCSSRGLQKIPSPLPSWVDTLDLSNNSLKDQEVSTELANYRHLSKLKLDNNFFMSMPIMSPMQELVSVSLSHNMISSFNADFWMNVPNLTTLDVSHNNISKLEKGSFRQNLHLTSLNLNSNRISNITSGSLDSLTKLTCLKLSRNSLTTFHKGLFKLLQNLRTLELNRNSLTKIDGLAFQGLDKLTVLKLRHNSIATLQDGAFWGLHSLRSLKLDHNRIRVVSRGWTYGLAALQELNLGNNEVHAVVEGSWDGCKHLFHLDMSNNRLKEIQTGTFKGLSLLQVLRLDGNMISAISEGAFNSTPSLRVLDLNRNHISWIIEDSSGIFGGLSALNKLGLASNRITSINRNAFSGLINLAELDLTGNFIKTIEENPFIGIPLSSLAVNTSGLVCDCSISWLNRWLEQSGVLVGHLSCAYPASIAGKLLTKVPEEQFLCSESESAKPVITNGPKSVIVADGSHLNLSCSAWSTDNSSLEFRWRRNNGEIPNPYKASVENNTAYLIFDKVSTHHAGVYQCIVSNNFGTDYSTKASLTVLVLPVIVKRPSNTTVRAGSTVRLECSAGGEPPPQVGWQKDGGTEFPAAHERRMHVMPTDDVFYIVNAKPADSGVYSCIARNSAGIVTANATLTVLEAPVLTRKMEDVRASIGRPVVLECIGSGWPRPRLRWWKNGAKLEAGPRHHFASNDQLLIIIDVQAKDEGAYTCEMYNTLGVDKASAQLYLDQPYTPTAEDMTGVIIISVVCCAVGTSAIWVIIIYQTRKRLRPTNGDTPASRKVVAHLDTKSEHSALSKDSGTGDSTKRSSEVIRIETGTSNCSDNRVSN